MGCGSSQVLEPSYKETNEIKKATTLKPARKIETLSNFKRCETLHKTPPMNEEL